MTLEISLRIVGISKSIRAVESRCLGWPLTSRKSSTLCGLGSDDLGMGGLRGRKVSKPLAVVQGRPWVLAAVCRLRAVMSMARV